MARNSCLHTPSLILHYCSVQVATKDGVLVLRHDLTLDDSTDIILKHPEFAGRK